MPEAEKKPAAMPASAPPRGIVAHFKQKFMLFFIMFMIIGPFLWWPITITVFTFSNTFIRALIVCYLIYIFTAGRDAMNRPGGLPPVVVRSGCWQWLRDYFGTTKLVKTVDLDPKEHYMFAGHPHGVACFGFVANLFVDASGFPEAFPGITVYSALLTAHFLTPVSREISLMARFRAPTKKAMLKILAGPPGSSMFIIPGGAAEVMHSAPGTLDLLVKKRKGFVRVAVEAGAHLVPVLSFGETDLFDILPPPPGSLTETMQRVVKNATGFAFPVLQGAGFLSGTGPLPRSSPLVTVIGKPIKVQRVAPTAPEFASTVDDLHAQYCDELKRLYDAHKDTYAKGRRRSMQFVE